MMRSFRNRIPFLRKKVTIEQWVEALRSGKYRQTTGLLRKNIDVEGDYGRAYCCLGVYAKEAGVLTWFGKVKGDTSGTGSYSHLPKARQPEWMSKSEMDQLMVLNDKRCYSFDQIADWVEENMMGESNV